MTLPYTEENLQTIRDIETSINSFRCALRRLSMLDDMKSDGHKLVLGTSRSYTVDVPGEVSDVIMTIAKTQAASTAQAKYDNLVEVCSGLLKF